MAGSIARRRRRVVALTALAVTVLLAAPSAAEPSPSARDGAKSVRQVRDRAAEVGRINAALAQADARLDDLSDQAELAVERFNGARARLDQAERDYQAARARAARASDRLAQTRRELAVFAANAYRSDNTYPSAAAVLGGRGGPEGFLDRAAIMQVLANRRQFAVNQERAAHTIADLFQRQARQALAAERDATLAAAAAQRSVSTAVARQQASVKQIEQQKSTLTAALTRAQAHTPDLPRTHDTARTPQTAPGLTRDTARAPQAAHGLTRDTARAPQAAQGLGRDLARAPQAAHGLARDAARAPQGARVIGGNTARAPQAAHRLGRDAARAPQAVHGLARDTARAPEAARGLPRGSGLGAVAARAALRWLGTPYSWGGGGTSGPSLGIAQGAHTVGFDCSGLVAYAWGKAGVHLVHYATAQYNAGTHPARNDLRPGDLVFFAHDPSNPATIHHVGIYIGHGQMVEAPFTGAHVRVSNAFRPDYAGATRPG